MCVCGTGILSSDGMEFVQEGGREREMREGYYNTINRFVCCLQSPIRSLGRLPLGLGSLNKIPCRRFLSLLVQQTNPSGKVAAASGDGDTPSLLVQKPDQNLAWLGGWVQV